MTPHVPIGCFVARACLAGAGLALLAGTDCGRRFEAARSAVPMAETRQYAERATTTDQGLAAAPSDPRWCHASRAVREADLARLSRGVHPIGLSSEGEPHDRRRQSAPAVATHTQQ